MWGNMSFFLLTWKMKCERAAITQELGMVCSVLPVRYLGIPLHGRDLHIS